MCSSDSKGLGCKKSGGDFPGGPVVRAPIARAWVLSLVGKLTSPKLYSAKKKKKKKKSDMGLGIHCQIQITLMIS